MAYKKTQNPLNISKTKSENIYNFIFDVISWQKLCEALNMSKSALFRYKAKLKSLYEEKGAFDAFSELFTIKEMNVIIGLFNDYIDNPENYQKKKRKKEVDLEKQKEVVNKNLAPMNMRYDEDLKNEDRRE
ncbi:hypothetical protein ACE3L8_12345 [Staphylococcus simulans]|uniref:hypothetical protein n=1 Tax=Staphylococcus simulans TaxID=1286 RepID=UPI003662BE3D